MRISSLGVALLGVGALMTGCERSDRVAGPVERPGKVDQGVYAIIEAAIRDAPMKLPPGSLVGILGTDQTPTERTVTYIVNHRPLDYRFLWSDGGWRRDHPLAAAAALPGGGGDPLPPVEPTAPPDAYTDPVGLIHDWVPPWGFEDVNLYATDVTHSGYWTADIVDLHGSAGYRDGLGYPASKSVAGTDYVIPADSMRWDYRTDAGSYDHCAKGAVYCFFDLDYGREAWLTFYVKVVKPISVAITSGPTYIPLQGTYTWSATAAGGDADDPQPMTYQWYYGEDGVTWIAQGTAATQRLSLTRQNQPSFWLRVTAGRSGRSATATRQVSVASPLFGNPALTGISTSPSPARQYQQFSVTLSGSNFNPATAQVVYTVPPCNPGIGCTGVISNSQLSVKTTTQLVIPAMSFGIVGDKYFQVQNGPTGPLSNSVLITVLPLPGPLAASIAAEPPYYTASPSGGYGPYTYQWEACAIDCAGGGGEASAAFRGAPLRTVVHGWQFVSTALQIYWTSRQWTLRLTVTDSNGAQAQATYYIP